MNIDTEALLALPVAEKMQLIELLWDTIDESSAPVPVPDWVEREAIRRRDEMLANPMLGSGHNETWDRIENRHG